MKPTPCEKFKTPDAARRILLWNLILSLILILALICCV